MKKILENKIINGNRMDKLTISFRTLSTESAYVVVVRNRDVQEPEQEPESSKFFRSRIGLGVKFNVKTGAGVTISLSYYCNVH